MILVQYFRGCLFDKQNECFFVLKVLSPSPASKVLPILAQSLLLNIDKWVGCLYQRHSAHLS